MTDKNDYADISMYTVQTEKYDTQETVNHYLETIGLDPMDTVCGTAASIMITLMQDFIARGGTYEAVCNNDLGRSYPKNYPRYALKVSYGSRYLRIWREVAQGCPVVVIHQPWMGSGTPVLPDILVHPDHLDPTLCHLLRVPHKDIAND